MNFALTDSVLHFNDGKWEHAGIFIRMRWKVSIPFYIYYWVNDTRRIYANAKKNTEKQIKKDYTN